MRALKSNGRTLEILIKRKMRRNKFAGQTPPPFPFRQWPPASNHQSSLLLFFFFFKNISTCHSPIHHLK
uniref:Uncharacterized protein n=1 Tax=Meloidogyne enterolobii TaxID=390850 RepID=A0A6V7TKI8_MELEN|nr:unnamed protein product [Meloidogyne enterolobii]